MSSVPKFFNAVQMLMLLSRLRSLVDPGRRRLITVRRWRGHQLESHSVLADVVVVVVVLRNAASCRRTRRALTRTQTHGAPKCTHRQSSTGELAPAAAARTAQFRVVSACQRPLGLQCKQRAPGPNATSQCVRPVYQFQPLSAVHLLEGGAQKHTLRDTDSEKLL